MPSDPLRTPNQIGSVGSRAAQDAAQIRKRLGGSGESALHQPSHLGQPSLHFALPLPQVRAEMRQPEPSALAGEQAEKAGASEPPDVRAIADRVYALMREELAQTRQRGGTRR